MENERKIKMKRINKWVAMSVIDYRSKATHWLSEKIHESTDPVTPVTRSTNLDLLGYSSTLSRSLVFFPLWCKYLTWNRFNFGQTTHKNNNNNRRDLKKMLCLKAEALDDQDYHQQDQASPSSNNNNGFILPISL